MGTRVKSYILILVTLAGGCRDAGSDAKTAGNATATAPALATPTAPAPEEEAVAPIVVAGIYLLSCSSDTRTSYVKKADAADSIVACIVADADGKQVDLETYATIVETPAGDVVTPEAVPKETEAPWQVGFRLPDQGAVTKVRLTGTAKGQPLALESSDLSFSWQRHPVFSAYVDLLRLTIKVIDHKAEFTDPTAAEPNAHMVFFTESYHSGDLGGPQGADAICVTEGSTLPFKTPRTHWKALLSTSKTDARDRVTIGGPVRDYEYERPSEAPDEFWRAEHRDRVRFTSAGRIIGQGTWDDALDLPVFLATAWMASTPTGVYDPSFGDCEGWTSSAATASGGGARFPAVPTDEETYFVDPWLTNGARRCNQLGRILCISQ